VEAGSWITGSNTVWNASDSRCLAASLPKSTLVAAIPLKVNWMAPPSMYIRIKTSKSRNHNHSYEGEPPLTPLGATL